MHRPSFRSLIIILAVAFTTSSCSVRSSDPLQLAEEALRSGNFPQAVALYQKHMSERLAAKNRPEWENPHFYELLIGDVYLSQGDSEQALAAYERAEKNGVHNNLVSDRYRAVARWFEDKGELQRAFDILEKYRDRDLLLFDAMLDRIGRELTAREFEPKVSPLL